MTICEDAYDARMMGIAVDFLRLVKDGDFVKEKVWNDLKKQIKLIEDGRGLP
jgi:hypothetical protein